MLTGLNRRFTNFGCGDLDYNNFKTSYFRSRNQQDEFFQEYYERNQLIMKEITIYSRQFSEYLKRKEKKSMLGKNIFM